MPAAKDRNIYTTTQLNNYAYMYTAIHKTGIPDSENPMTSNLETMVLTQYHVSKGFKIYGKKGENAVLKELKQLHDRMVMGPLEEETMNNKDKQK